MNAVKRKRNFNKKQWDIIYLLWQNLTPEQIIKQCPEYNMNQIKRVLYWLRVLQFKEINNGSK